MKFIHSGLIYSGDFGFIKIKNPEKQFLVLTSDGIWNGGVDLYKFEQILNKNIDSECFDKLDVLKQRVYNVFTTAITNFNLISEGHLEAIDNMVFLLIPFNIAKSFCAVIGDGHGCKKPVETNQGITKLVKAPPETVKHVVEKYVLTLEEALELYLTHTIVFDSNLSELEISAAEFGNIPSSTSYSETHEDDSDSDPDFYNELRAFSLHNQIEFFAVGNKEDDESKNPELKI